MQNESSQDRRLVKTGTPGIYKRGNRYVVRYRDPRGRDRKRFARTLAEARDLRTQLGADLSRGEYLARSTVGVRVGRREVQFGAVRCILEEWIERKCGLSRMVEPKAPVAQWIEQRFPKPRAQVRFLPGASAEPAGRRLALQCVRVLREVDEPVRQAARDHRHNLD